jgi:hypothetical protein
MCSLKIGCESDQAQNSRAKGVQISTLPKRVTFGSRIKINP